MVRVRKAARYEVDPLTDTLAAALFDDPPNRWFFPDSERRHEALPAFFKLFVEAALPLGEVYTTDELVACALWIPPDAPPPSAEQAAAFEREVVELAGDEAHRPIAMIEILEANHPTQPHFYLNFVGTRPERQRQGIGTAVLAPVLDRCDAQGIPAYLEASHDRNRRLYERLGFAVRSELRAPGGPLLWGMWREPIPD